MSSIDKTAPPSSQTPPGRMKYRVEELRGSVL